MYTECDGSSSTNARERERFLPTDGFSPVWERFSLTEICAIPGARYPDIAVSEFLPDRTGTVVDNYTDGYSSLNLEGRGKPYNTPM